VAGIVRVRFPGAERYVRVTAPLVVAFGTAVEVTFGHAQVTVAGPKRSIDRAVLWDGEFRLLESSGRRGFAQVELLRVAAAADGAHPRGATRVVVRAGTVDVSDHVHHLTVRIRAGGRYVWPRGGTTRR
jgi:hypothetical protein